MNDKKKKKMEKNKKPKQKKYPLIICFLLFFFYCSWLGYALAVSPSKLHLIHEEGNIMIYNPSQLQHPIIITVKNQTPLTISRVQQLQEHQEEVMQREKKRKESSWPQESEQKAGLTQKQVILDPSSAILLWFSRKNNNASSGEIMIETNNVQYTVPVMIEAYKKNEDKSNQYYEKNINRKIIGIGLLVVGIIGIVASFFFFNLTPTKNPKKNDPQQTTVETSSENHIPIEEKYQK